MLEIKEVPTKSETLVIVNLSSNQAPIRQIFSGYVIQAQNQLDLLSKRHKVTIGEVEGLQPLPKNTSPIALGRMINGEFKFRVNDFVNSDFEKRKKTLLYWEDYMNKDGGKRNPQESFISLLQSHQIPVWDSELLVYIKVKE